MPELSELHREIVPKCAAKWRDLGVELKIPVHHLDAIAVNNAHHPSYSQQCCTAVIQKWMEITPNPTWTVLQKAIDSLSGLSYEGSSESKRDVIVMYELLFHFVKPVVRWQQANRPNTHLVSRHCFCPRCV